LVVEEFRNVFQGRRRWLTAVANGGGKRWRQTAVADGATAAGATAKKTAQRDVSRGAVRRCAAVTIRLQAPPVDDSAVSQRLPKTAEFPEEFLPELGTGGTSVAI
jgi:hypothetical protein